MSSLCRDEFEAEDEEREVDSEANRPLSQKALELRVMRNVRRREVAIAKAEQQHANRFGGTSGVAGAEPSTTAAGGGFGANAAQSGASAGGEQQAPRRMSGQGPASTTAGPAASSRPGIGLRKEGASGTGTGAESATTAAPPETSASEFGSQQPTAADSASQPPAAPAPPPDAAARETSLIERAVTIAKGAQPKLTFEHINAVRLTS